jgi:acetyl/propionyl-CoA carboxylase alpha subunit
LERTALLGLTTNRDYLIGILNHPAFLSGELSTRFLEDHMAGRGAPAGDPAPALIAAALACWERDAIGGPGYWRNNPGLPTRYPFRVDGREVECRLRPASREAGRFTVTLSLDESKEYAVALESYEPSDMTLTIDGVRQRVALAQRGSEWWVASESATIRLEEVALLPEPRRAADAGGSLRAPMPGAVLAVLVEVGQIVAEGQALMKLEAMKMEHVIRAAAAGVVEVIYFNAGDQVGADELLVSIGEV